MTSQEEHPSDHSGGVPSTDMGDIPDQAADKGTCSSGQASDLSPTKTGWEASKPTTDKGTCSSSQASDLSQTWSSGEASMPTTHIGPEGNIDRQWDVELMCNLSGMIRDDEFGILKEETQVSEKERLEKEKCNLMLRIREEQETYKKLRSQDALKDQAIKEAQERLAISEKNGCLSPEQLPSPNAFEISDQNKRQFEQSDRQGSDETEKVAIQQPFVPSVSDGNEIEEDYMNDKEEVSSYGVGFTIKRPFTEDLNAPNSAGYRKLEKDVTKMMKTAIGDDLIEVTILGFKKGCINIYTTIKVKKGVTKEKIEEKLREGNVCECGNTKEVFIYVIDDEKLEQDDYKTTIQQTGNASGDRCIANISADSFTLNQTFHNTVVDCKCHVRAQSQSDNESNELFKQKYAEQLKANQQLRDDIEKKDIKLAEYERREKSWEIRKKDGEPREKKCVDPGIYLPLGKRHYDLMCMQLKEDPAIFAKEKNERQNQTVGTYLDDAV